jgi:hypothetical protein
MSIVKKLDIRPETVEAVYNLYRKNSLLVNRKYQRKLVWTVQEKENFIDSIANGYPVPLFLVALTFHKGESVYEIIDGMQRLNAVISFIENEFHYDGKYFNMDSTATTKILKDTGKIKQKIPALGLEKCAEIATYQLPLSISSYNKEDKIEEIFRRINANGRQLSSHELRQAGAIGEFPDIIRDLSEKIRGDVSHSDKLLLGEMQKISINNSGLPYGINLKEIFWHKHGILTQSNIRASRDEELIAHLVSAMLLNNKINNSSTALDKVYGVDENGDNIDIDAKLKTFGGAEFVKSQFEAIFDELRKTLVSSGKNYRSLLFKSENIYTNRSFQIIFLAFQNLLVKKGLKIANYKDLANSLTGIGDKFISPHIDDLRHHVGRQRCVEAICGIITKHFVRRDETDPILSNGVIKLETLLSRSKTENTCYDFKQGVHQMNDLTKDIRQKIVETLTAMVNIGKQSVGYIILGVADSKHIADQHKAFYHSTPVSYENFFITGVDDECDKAGYKNLDEYRTKLEQFISNCDIQPAYYAQQILKNIDLFSYSGKTVIIIKIEASHDPIKFQGKYFHREGTSTKEIPSGQERQLWELFIR